MKFTNKKTALTKVGFSRLIFIHLKKNLFFFCYCTIIQSYKFALQATFIFSVNQPYKVPKTHTHTHTHTQTKQRFQEKKKKTT